MKDSLFGELSIIGMRGCEDFTAQVDSYLKDWRSHDQDVSYIADCSCPRFGSGEGKGALHQSLRGNDVYIISDVFNHGVTYNMYGKTVPMSPDDHFQDLKRIIGAIGGKARRINVIMPMLYEGRQHKRSSRESLDCALALQELTNMGITNLITFDAHDPRVQNAIPLHGFENVRTSYIKHHTICRSSSRRRNRNHPCIGHQIQQRCACGAGCQFHNIHIDHHCHILLHSANRQLPLSAAYLFDKYQGYSAGDFHRTSYCRTCRRTIRYAYRNSFIHRSQSRSIPILRTHKGHQTIKSRINI